MKLNARRSLIKNRSKSAPAAVADSELSMIMIEISSQQAAVHLLISEALKTYFFFSRLQINLSSPDFSCERSKLRGIAPNRD